MSVYTIIDSSSDISTYNSYTHAGNCFYSKFTGEQIDEAIGAVLRGKAILITNCPNCGAPVHGTKCEYCGTVFAR